MTNEELNAQLDAMKVLVDGIVAELGTMMAVLTELRAEVKPLLPRYLDTK